MRACRGWLFLGLSIFLKLHFVSTSLRVEVLAGEQMEERQKEEKALRVPTGEDQGLTPMLVGSVGLGHFVIIGG